MGATSKGSLRSSGFRTIDKQQLTLKAQLWRPLFLSTFSASNSTTSTWSPIARRRPWRELYKVSANWRRGSVRTSSLGFSGKGGTGLIGQSIRGEVLAEVPASLDVGENIEVEERDEARVDRSQAGTNSGEERREMDTLLQFHQQTYITASRSTSPSPQISVHQQTPEGESILLGRFGSTALDRFWNGRTDREDFGITEMRLDERPTYDTPATSYGMDDDSSATKQLKLIVFYSTGQFSVFELSLSSSPADFLATELWTQLTLTPSFIRTDPIFLARLYSPLLVTCSRNFVIRFWKVSSSRSAAGTVAEGAGETGWKVEEVEGGSYRSGERFDPVVLTVLPVQAKRRRKSSEETRFKVTIAYSTPVFPSRWTVGVQQFDVRMISPLPTSSASSSPYDTRRDTVAIHGQFAAAPLLDNPSFWNSYNASRATGRPIREEGLVTAIEHSPSSPWIITSKSDNTIEVYEIISTAGRKKGREELGIVHRRTLFGHTSAVASIALSTSPNVSRSRDRIESLESDEGEDNAAQMGKEETEERGDDRVVSSSMDGYVKVWSLGRASRNRSYSAVDILESPDHSPTSSPSHTPSSPIPRDDSLRSFFAEGGFQVLKQAREERKGGRTRKVWIDEDKIVSVVESGEGGRGEDVKVFRFD